MFAKLLSFTFYLFFCINIHFFYEYQEYRSCNGKDRYVTGALYKNVKYQTESQSYASSKSEKLNCKLLHTFSLLECLTKLIVFCLQSINQLNVLEPMSLQFVVKLKFNQDDLKLMFKKVSMKKKKEIRLWPSCFKIIKT